MLENVRLKQVFDEEKVLQISHPCTKIKRYAFAPQLLCSSCALSDRHYFPALHNICCKCCVLPCYLVFDEENAQLLSSHPSTMSLLLSGILFRIALYQDDQTYKFGQQGQCLLEAITLKSEQWGKDRDWNVPPLQMDSWSIIGKFSTWEGRDGYIISFSSSKIEIFTEIMSMMSMKICWDDFASWIIVGVLSLSLSL